MKTHYVYKITDPITGQYYIGSRTSKDCKPEEDDYMGSYCAWTPTNESRLEKKILGKYYTRALANSVERKLLIEKLKIENDKKCMNAHIPGIGFHNYDRKFTEAHKNKIRNSLVGRKYTEKRKRKISNAHKGKKLSKEHRRKIGEANRGKRRSEKIRKKMSKNHWDCSGKNHPMYGMTGSLSPSSKMVQCLQENCCENETYSSLRECGYYHNVTGEAVSYHCKRNPKNQKYKFV